MDYNTNNAYDLALFSQRSSYVRAARTEAGSARAKKNSRGSGSGSKTMTPERRAEERRIRERRQAITKWAQILAFGMLGVIAITLLVGNRVEYHELTMQIDKANNELTELRQDYEALRVEFDNKMSDSAVEEYAVNVLGMQKRENSQTEYISLNVDNVFEIGSEQSFDWYQTNLENILSYGD